MKHQSSSDKTGLLFVSHNQFGYFSIYYNYCSLLEKQYQISYLCFHQGLPEIAAGNVRVEYVKSGRNKILRHLRFFRAFLKILTKGEHKVVIFKYFRFVSLYRCFFPFKKIFIDIRTGSLRGKDWSRHLENLIIKLETLFFSHILVLSGGLSLRLGLPVSKTTVVPLGAFRRESSPKDFSELRLLYIGSLNNRRVHDTVSGLALFAEKSPAVVSYDIIGFGSNAEETRLMKTIKDHGLERIVHFHGRLYGDSLHPFLDRCNTGVAFVPLTKGYDVQPVTKLFEFMLSGIPVIATATAENRRVVNAGNGILIEDSPVDFARGLEEFFGKRDNWDQDLIKDSVKDYDWERIVWDKLVPLFQK